MQNAQKIFFLVNYMTFPRMVASFTTQPLTGPSKDLDRTLAPLEGEGEGKPCRIMQPIMTVRDEIRSARPFRQAAAPTERMLRQSEIWRWRYGVTGRSWTI